MVLFCVALVVGALTALYFYLTSNYNYWTKRGIPQAKNPIPGVGHMGPQFLMTANIGEIYERIYKEGKGHSMVGLYSMRTPVLLIRDPELIKTVLQTNFSSFHENMIKIDPVTDPLFAKNPFFCEGEEWAHSRKRITYAFSSMRLKILAETVNRVNKKFDDYLTQQLKNGEKREYNLKELFGRYTGEVVANAGFGLEGCCFDDTKKKDSFMEMGRKVFESALSTDLLRTLVFFMPKLNKVLRISFLPTNVDRYFRELVADLLQTRKKETIPRKDFLQLMVDQEMAAKKELDAESIETILAHTLSFFIDGYETSSLTLSFVGFHLATHPDVQGKLRNEVLTVLAKHDGCIDYEAIKEMTYMNQVISESQRIHPAAGMVGKVCTEPFDFKGNDGLTCHVEPGTQIIVSLYGLHMDPNYWSQPEVFDPNRFAEDRKQDQEKFAFLPFGEGPRMCVGMRMAVLQMKACLATLLSKYSLELSPKTQLPIKYDPDTFLTMARGGLWAYIRKI